MKSGIQQELRSSDQLQEHFTIVFYQIILGTEVVIFVYDITRKKTFEEIKKYWIKEIKLFTKENVSKITF